MSEGKVPAFLPSFSPSPSSPSPALRSTLDLHQLSSSSFVPSLKGLRNWPNITSETTKLATATRKQVPVYQKATDIACLEETHNLPPAPPTPLSLKHSRVPKNDTTHVIQKADNDVRIHPPSLFHRPLPPLKPDKTPCKPRGNVDISLDPRQRKKTTTRRGAKLGARLHLEIDIHE